MTCSVKVCFPLSDNWRNTNGATHDIIGGVREDRFKEPGRYGDGRGGYGLSLLVKPMTSTGRTVSRPGAQRLRSQTARSSNIGIGSFPVVSLSQARDKALENKRTLAEGCRPSKLCREYADLRGDCRQGDCASRRELARQRQVRKAMAGQFADLCLYPTARQQARCLYHGRRRPGSAHADLECEAGDGAASPPTDRTGLFVRDSAGPSPRQSSRRRYRRGFARQRGSQEASTGAAACGGRRPLVKIRESGAGQSAKAGALVCRPNGIQKRRSTGRTMGRNRHSVSGRGRSRARA